MIWMPLTALLEGLEATPAMVIGRSYGGEIGLELALRHPQTVRGLVLLEPAVLGLSASAASFAEPLTREVLRISSVNPRAVAETFLARCRWGRGVGGVSRPSEGDVH